MSDGEIAIVICKPVASLGRPILGSLQRICASCGCSIWVSPSTIQKIIEEPGEFRLQCGDCAIPMMVRDPNAELKPLSKGQIVELANEFARRKAESR